MRLQKFLSQSGYCSRSQAEQLIKDRKVTINSKLARLGDQVEGNETVEVNGKVIGQSEISSKVICFYKPQGVACSLSPSPSGESLLDFDFGGERFFPIGYLDHFAEGILLLTNDGGLCNKLTQKSSEVFEIYHAELDREIDERELEKFIRQLGEKVGEIKVEQKSATSLELVMKGGRSKDIRKIFGKQEITLAKLYRHSLGSYAPTGISPGQHISLNNGEISKL